MRTSLMPHMALENQTNKLTTCYSLGLDTLYVGNGSVNIVASEFHPANGVELKFREIPVKIILTHC